MRVPGALRHLAIAPRDNDQGQIDIPDPEEKFKAEVARRLNVIEKMTVKGLEIGRALGRFYRWVERKERDDG